MKGLIAAALVAISIVALGGNSDQTAAHKDDSQLQQGVARVDHVLQRGLSKDTHDKLAEQADSSAQWLRGFGSKVQGATD